MLVSKDCSSSNNYGVRGPENECGGRCWWQQFLPEVAAPTVLKEQGVWCGCTWQARMTGKT